MKNLFDPEAPFFQMLTRVGDLIILNVLTIICSIPIITAGAALAALYKMVFDMHYDTEGSTVKGYFAAFKANFRQATIEWVIILVVAVSLLCDWLLLLTYFGGNTFMFVLLAILALVVLGVQSYMLPLLVRYRNTLKEHMSNAVVLALIKLPRTLLLVFLNVLPLLIFWVSVAIFVQTLIFWVFIGFAFAAYVQGSVLKPVFDQLEQGKDKVTLGM